MEFNLGIFCIALSIIYLYYFSSLFSTIISLSWFRLIDWCLMPTLAVFQICCGVIFIIKLLEPRIHWTWLLIGNNYNNRCIKYTLISLTVNLPIREIYVRDAIMKKHERHHFHWQMISLSGHDLYQVLLYVMDEDSIFRAVYNYGFSIFSTIFYHKIWTMICGMKLRSVVVVYKNNFVCESEKWNYQSASERCLGII